MGEKKDSPKSTKEIKVSELVKELKEVINSKDKKNVAETPKNTKDVPEPRLLRSKDIQESPSKNDSVKDVSDGVKDKKEANKDKNQAPEPIITKKVEIKLNKVDIETQSPSPAKRTRKSISSDKSDQTPETDSREQRASRRTRLT